MARAVRQVRGLALGLAVSCLAEGRAAAQSALPTTPCAPPPSAAAGAICATPALVQADIGLAQAHAALAARLAADQQAILMDNHRQWVAYRDACGADPACLARAISERTASLRAAVAGQGGVQGGSPSAAADTAEAAGQRLTEAFLALAARLDAAQRGALDANQAQWAAQIEQTCGRAPSCLIQAMNERTAALQAALPSAAAPAQAAQSVTVPQGSWYGRMTCKERHQTTEIETEFTALRQPDGTYTLRMVLVGPEAMQLGSTEIDFVGEPSADTPGAIRFVVSTVRRAALFRGNERLGLLFDPASGSMRVQAPQNGPECETFTARAMLPDDPRLRITVPLPPGGGLYAGAADDRARCETLIAWSERLNREFPDRNSRRGKWMLLFADDDFVPVFGLPYDAMPVAARSAIVQFVRQTCRANPFTRDRLETFAAIDDVFGEGPEEQFTSGGYSAAVFAIREIRRLRNAARITAAPAGQTAEAALAQLDQDRAQLKQYAGRLWPGEIAGLDEGLVARAAAVATAEADRRLALAQAEPDPVRALPLLEAARAPALLSRLPEAAARQRKDTIEAQVTAAADRLAAPVLARADAVAPDLQGLAELGTLLDTPLPEALPAARKAALRDDLGRRQSALLERLVAERVAALTSNGGAGRQALETDAAGQRQFDSDFARFGDHAALKKARATLAGHREAMLERSLPAFAADMAAARTRAEADRLLSAYLSLPGDLSLPVSLEFQLLAAGLP